MALASSAGPNAHLRGAQKETRRFP
jgi:hypothetical protein